MKLHSIALQQRPSVLSSSRRAQSNCYQPLFQQSRQCSSEKPQFSSAVDILQAILLAIIVILLWNNNNDGNGPRGGRMMPAVIRR